MSEKIIVKFNGKRFPRIVNLRGGDRVSFHPYVKILELNEYDALLLLKSNSRLTPDKWEFTVLKEMPIIEQGNELDDEKYIKEENSEENLSAKPKKTKAKK
jgi:hypothetical protein